MISVLQDTFPYIYSGLYGLPLPCIYSMCKNCMVVCIYNNTACSHCVRALHDCLSVAGHRFMCPSVIGPGLSAPFFQRHLPPPLVRGFVMMEEQAGCVLRVCVRRCVFPCAHCRVRVCARLRSDHYDWAVSLFFSLNDPAHSKLRRALFHHCA